MATQRSNIVAHTREVLRIAAALKQQRALLNTYRVDYERPADLLTKRAKCALYAKAVARYRSYWRWITQLNDADLEDVYCDDLESDEKLAREVCAFAASATVSTCERDDVHVPDRFTRRFRPSRRACAPSARRCTNRSTAS